MRSIDQKDKYYKWKFFLPVTFSPPSLPPPPSIPSSPLPLSLCSSLLTSCAQNGPIEVSGHERFREAAEKLLQYRRHVMRVGVRQIHILTLVKPASDLYGGKHIHNCTCIFTIGGKHINERRRRKEERSKQGRQVYCQCTLVLQ